MDTDVGFGPGGVYAAGLESCLLARPKVSVEASSLAEVRWMPGQQAKIF